MMSQNTINRRSMLQISATSATGALAVLAQRSAFADPRCASPNQSPETTEPSPTNDSLPNDSRLGNLKDLDGYFPFQPSPSVDAWNQRKEFVKRQILVACGLWPMPDRPAIEATVHGRVEREDYTVDRVYFESSPGLLVTGSLYKPKGAMGRLPTVLCPHGHWANGRFYDHGPNEIQRQLESGGEQDPVCGRFPLQARSVQLARLGCMVFLYDMLGYADGGSFSQDLIHGFGKQRPHLSSADKWGLFSAQSELRCINAMGLQTWNSIRALDWIMSRDDCDTTRVGVTGASGGGTQTFILTAIDDRVAAAFPAVMVSTAMQGGCTCENASLLRVNTGNIEFAAMAAPRPIAMTGADDWTVDIETKGLPELKQHYQMMGVPDLVQAKYMKFPHNYNLPSRMMMYDFFNRTLKLGAEDLREKSFVPLTIEEATVFGADHPAPPKNETTELAILHAIDSANQKQMAALTPRDAAGLKEFTRVVGGALEVIIGRRLPDPSATQANAAGETSHGNYRQINGTLRLTTVGEELPSLLLLPDHWNAEIVLWFDLGGKEMLFGADNKPTAEIATLLEKGFAVASVDLYLSGDFTTDGQPVSQMPVVKNPREFVGYTLGYNHSLFAQRTHDILTAIASTHSHPEKPKKTHLVGVGGAGPMAIAAAAIARDQLTSLAVDTKGFRFASIVDYRDPNLLPGAVKYGDLPAMLALCAPLPVAISGEQAGDIELAAAAYQSASAQLNLLAQGDSIASWLQRVGQQR